LFGTETEDKDNNDIPVNKEKFPWPSGLVFSLAVLFQFRFGFKFHSTGIAFEFLAEQIELHIE
jgi:hypothetical protein